MNNNNELLKSFILALGFMTRLPTPQIENPSTKVIANIPFFYPLVGIIIGLILLVVASLTAINNFLLAVLLVAVWVIITGALHLDGLADLADALIGGLGSKEKTKQILKDPHVGVHGVVSLVLVLLVKTAAVYSLLLENSLFVLFLAPLLARLFILPLIAKTNYYQSQGIAHTLFANVDKDKLNRYFYLVLTMVGLLVLVFYNAVFINVLISTIVLALLAFYLRKTAINRLGGMSGDVLGAAIELAEMLFLFLISCLIT